MRHGFDLGYKIWVHHGEPDLPPPPPVIDNTREPQMSDMTALHNDHSYIPPNNEHNEPTQGDIGETSNKPTQNTRNEFEELYASTNEELYHGCDYVTRLDFMAKFTYFKVKGKDIDVYLRPLIKDLKVLWDQKGVETIDVALGQKFNMRVMVLWTINDFPARSNLPGWSGQGYKACPTCNKDTPSVRVLSKTAYVGHRRFLNKTHKWRSSRKFNGQTDNRDPPKEFGRDEILAQLDRLPTRLTDQIKVVDILCDLELIYLPALFDIMIHLVIHLPLEALEGGHIRPRWMFSFERYMKKLKGYVRNKAKPEGSIAEGYVAEEALTFSSHYFRDVTTKFNRPDRNVDPPPPTLNSCVVDGVRYVVHNRDDRRINQNSGICSPGPDGEMYYGQLQEILEFNLNDLDNATFHIDGQSTEVDVPPDIIDVVDEDDDITDDEDALPRDLADSNNEDLINVDDDGVEKMLPGPTAVTVEVRITLLHTMYPTVAWVALLTEAKANESPIWAAGQRAG
nr:hypothetical protein [Tanacetum cinerariifolium]